jgi:hypothetical protein
MKPKALKKRFVLNKKTIVDLGKTKMSNVHGGHDSSPTCPAFTKYNCDSVYIPCVLQTIRLCTDPYC